VKRTAFCLLPFAFCLLPSAFCLVSAQQKSPGAGPIVVLETAKGTIEFETYPDEAPKTVAQVTRLVREGFYDGQRFHRAEPDFLVQAGDPRSRDEAMREWWGRSASGTPIGAAEITKKRRNVRGAVAMAYPGSDPRTADSQFYILLKDHPELDARYTVFGRVLKGMDIVDLIQVADVIRKAYLRE
jgi:cyclophilin family peptidyl-prolyl cis-trans isomerase